MAQSVTRPTFDFSSCHDLTVRETEPCVELCIESGEPVWDSLPLSLHHPHSQVRACSLNKQTNKQRTNFKKKRNKVDIKTFSDKGKDSP